MRLIYVRARKRSGEFFALLLWSWDQNIVYIDNKFLLCGFKYEVIGLSLNYSFLYENEAIIKL